MPGGFYDTQVLFLVTFVIFVVGFRSAHGVRHRPQEDSPRRSRRGRRH